LFNKKRIVFGGKLKTCPDTWMEHRINLFLSITLPSMMAQTCQNFEWLVFLDENTPSMYKDALLWAEYDNMKLIYVKDEPLVERAFDCITGEDIITTRLDNDDALNINAIKEIQNAYYANTSTIPPYAIDMPLGYTFDLAKHELYATNYVGNANISLVERRRDLMTVWCMNHGEIAQKYETRQIFSLHGWIITIHHYNIGNNTGSNPGRTVYIDNPLSLDLLDEFAIKLTNLENVYDYRSTC
jgi:hypothetical protein